SRSPAPCRTRAWAREPRRATSARRQSKCVLRESSTRASAGPEANRPPHSAPDGVVPLAAISVRPDFHRGALERDLLVTGDRRVVGDDVGTAGGQGAEQRPVLHEHLALV